MLWQAYKLSKDTIYKIFIHHFVLMMNKIQWDDVKEDYFKKLTFLSLPLASKHSAFLLKEVSASEVPVIQKKFVVKEVTSDATILKLSYQAVLM